MRLSKKRPHKWSYAFRIFAHIITDKVDFENRCLFLLFPLFHFRASLRCVYVLFSLSFGLPFTNQANNVRNERQQKKIAQRQAIYIFFPFVLLECVYFQQRVNMSLGPHNVTFCVDLFMKLFGSGREPFEHFYFEISKIKKAK